MFVVEVNELKAQMKRMEEMVKMKNSKIQELTLQVEKLNNGSGGGKAASGKNESPVNGGKVAAGKTSGK